MLRDSEPLRLFGVPYRAVFIGLAVSALILILLLVFNFPKAVRGVEDWISLEAFLKQFRADWTKLLIIASLLAVTAGAAALAAYSYYRRGEELARVQATAKAILENLAGGVLTFDREGRLTVINRAARQMLELERAPRDRAELAERHAELAAIIRAALEESVYAQDHDSTYVGSQGTRLRLRTNISGFVDAGGARIGIVVLVKDVTRLVEMERELRKRERLAAAGSLAAGVAHEIRNPLSALELNLRLLREEVQAAVGEREELEGYFEVLSAEARRLNRITTSFLQLSRPEALVKAPVTVQEPLLRVVKLLETEAREKGIYFALHLGADEAVVLGDATKLEQVCLNILINAMQAMPGGGIVRISTRARRGEEGALAEVEIQDQGTGIPPEDIPRLFDPYFTTRVDGIGLGLAIADRIATDHGGRILVESAEGKGTTMTVRLPLAEESAARRG